MDIMGEGDMNIELSDRYSRIIPILEKILLNGEIEKVFYYKNDKQIQEYRFVNKNQTELIVALIDKNQFYFNIKLLKEIFKKYNICIFLGDSFLDE